MNASTLKRLAYQFGTDVCGIASINRFMKAPQGFHPTDIFSEAQSVIIIGKSFPKGTYLVQSRAPYTMVRNQLIQEIDSITLRLSKQIEEAEGKATPIPSSDPYEFWNEQEKHGRGIMSLKHAAELAGLGYIGKNTLLLNEKYGNRLWLGGIITDLILEADALIEKHCPANCSVCLDACPQSALDGITINQKKCREICFTSTEGGGWLIACNLCRVKCPQALT